MRIYREYSLLGLSALNDFVVTPAHAALVVVDMQYGSTHPDYGFQRLYKSLGMEQEIEYFQERVRSTVVPNIQRLLEGFRAAKAEVVFLTVGSARADYGDFCSRRLARIRFWRDRGIEVPYARVGTPDLEVISELAPRPGEAVINKTTASAFNSSNFESYLRSKEIDALVVTGVGTNYCVEMTFRDASDKGFLCVLVEDACATSTPEMHARAMDTMSFYGRVLPTEAVLREIGQGTTTARSSR